MIRPVCVYHAQLRYRRISFFRIFEIFTAESEVVRIHGKSHFADKFLNVAVIHVIKAVNGFYVLGICYIHIESLRFFQRCLACLNGVYNVLFSRLDIFGADVSHKYIHLCAAYSRAFLFRKYRNTFLRRRRTLVKLPRQKLNGEHPAVRFAHFLVPCVIHGRFRKDKISCLCIFFIAYSLNVIAIYNSDPFKTRHGKILT